MSFGAIEFSFWQRLVVLVLLMIVIAAIDLLLRRQEATKYREYGLILVAGCLGALIGGVNDWFTFSISPEYFTLGKDLSGDNLRWQALLYGLQVGFSAGAISGGVCLYVARRKPDGACVSYGFLYRRILLLIPIALLSGVIVPLVASGFDPFGFSASLKDAITPEAIARFRLVWWIHSGLYLGLALGVIGLLIRISRQRKANTLCNTNECAPASD